MRCQAMAVSVWWSMSATYMHAMNTTDLMALVMLAQDDPTGTYLMEELDGQLILWRMSEGGPEDEAARSLIADAC